MEIKSGNTGTNNGGSPDTFDSLDGLDTAAAKEYILGVLSTLKLTEKEIITLTAEETKWDNRVNLAAEKGAADLRQEAEKERDRIRERRSGLETEAFGLRLTLEKLRSQLLILPAKERSVDPDLLEQELLILGGRMPGEENEAARDRTFAKMEKDASAEEALQALKSRIGK
ncbi:MAG: chromosome partitioning protein [Treponema sp.]|nr:chromosome partitioning protein [Treponema sp.]